MEPITLNTPVGIASYPHITAPDSYQGKESYKCTLRLDPNNAGVSDFIDRVNSFVAKAKEEASAAFKEELAGLDLASKNPKTQKQVKKLNQAVEDIDEEFRNPIEQEFDRDTDEPTGNWLIKTRSNASFKDRKTGKVIEIQPKLFDATGHPITGERPEIRGGSKLALGIKLKPYHASFGSGVSVQLNAVQVVSLASGGSSGGGSFAAVDGGYVAPKQEFTPKADSSNCDY